MKKTLLFLLINLVLFSGAKAQRTADSLTSITQFAVTYGFHFPGADLADRFGSASTVGLNFNYKTNANWIWGVSGNYLFGSNINEPNHMDNITTSTGAIIDQGGIIATVLKTERGGIFGFSVGKIFPTNRINPNSGILVQISPGYMYHQILTETEENNTPQIMDDYKAGYDRLSGGFQVEQFIGFVHYDDNNLYNFYGGFEFRQGFTKSLRPYDFDLMSSDTKNRVDLMFGIKVGWIVPIIKRENLEREHIFY